MGRKTPISPEMLKLFRFIAPFPLKNSSDNIFFFRVLTTKKKRTFWDAALCQSIEGLCVCILGGWWKIWDFTEYGKCQQNVYLFLTEYLLKNFCSISKMSQ